MNDLPIQWSTHYFCVVEFTFALPNINHNFIYTFWMLIFEHVIMSDVFNVLRISYKYHSIEVLGIIGLIKLV